MATTPNSIQTWINQSTEPVSGPLPGETFDNSGQLNWLNQLLSEGPVFTDQMGQDMLNATNVENENTFQSGINNLLNPTAPSSFSGILSSEQSAGTTALNAKAAPNAPNTNVQGFENASANATGGNINIPQVEQQYEQQAAQTYQSQVTNYQNAQQAGQSAIQQLGDPNLATALTMSYMTPMLETYLGGLKNQYGYDVTSAYDAIVQNMQNVQSFNSQMSSLFSNYLGIQYNIPAQTQAAVTSGDYSAAMQQGVQGALSTIAAAPPPTAGGD